MRRMTLAATETIDLVMLTRDRGTLKLVIVATEDLRADGPAVEQLRSKLAFYRNAICSGRFNEMFPQYAALPKLIQLDHYTPLGLPNRYLRVARKNFTRMEFASSPMQAASIPSEFCLT